MTTYMHQQLYDVNLNSFGANQIFYNDYLCIIQWNIKQYMLRVSTALRHCHQIPSHLTHCWPTFMAVKSNWKNYKEINQIIDRSTIQPLRHHMASVGNTELITKWPPMTDFPLSHVSNSLPVWFNLHQFSHHNSMVVSCRRPVTTSLLANWISGKRSAACSWLFVKAKQKI